MKRNYISPNIHSEAINSMNTVLAGSMGDRIATSGLSGTLTGGNAPMDLSGAR